MEILVATSNPHKLKEIAHILKGIRVVGRGIRVKEDGKTFEENAAKKALTLARRFQEPALADDSGLMVNCLKGKPGVKSARFATPPTPQNLCTKLLREMSKAKSKARGAKFVCVIALAYPNGKVRFFKGICRGRIISEMRGGHGFGYDPIFKPCGYSKTFAEMPPALKNKISHRARALKMLKSCLRARSSVDRATDF